MAGLKSAFSTAAKATPPVQQRTTSQLTLQGQSQLVATSQSRDQRQAAQGSESGVGVVRWALHLGPTLYPRPGLVVSQAMAFGLFWCKHSDPEIAVDLVRSMFTLRLRYYMPESKLPPLAPAVQRLLHYTHGGIASKHLRVSCSHYTAFLFL